MRAQFVYDELRANLLDGRFQPGERLKVPALSERFSLSLTVIREALTRLAEQGLVTFNPKRGFSVMALSGDDLRDLTFARIQLETLTLRTSIERGDLDWETHLVGALHALVQTRQVDDSGGFNVEWFARHRDYHHALLAGCGSPRLLTITDAERDRAELYRAWARSIADDTGRNTEAEHEEIARLALARDPQGAVEALTAHIQRTTDVLLRYAEDRSSPVAPFSRTRA